MKVLLLLLSLFAAGCGHLPLLAKTTNPVRPHWSDLAPPPGCVKVEVPFRGFDGITRDLAIARAMAAFTPPGEVKVFRSAWVRVRTRADRGVTALACPRPPAE